MRTEADLRRAFAHIADTAPGPAIAASRIRRRNPDRQAGRHRVLTGLVAASVGLVLVGVLAAVVIPLWNSSGQAGGPKLEEQYSGSMTIDPQPAKPGDQITVTVNSPSSAGVAFTLEAWTGSNWHLEYYLVSDYSGKRPVWWTVDDPPASAGWPDVGGALTPHLIVPPVAPPGVYRLCSEYDPATITDPAARKTAAPRPCALLTVTP